MRIVGWCLAIINGFILGFTLKHAGLDMQHFVIVQLASSMLGVAGILVGAG